MKNNVSVAAQQGIFFNQQHANKAPNMNAGPGCHTNTSNMNNNQQPHVQQPNNNPQSMCATVCNSHSPFPMIQNVTINICFTFKIQQMIRIPFHKRNRSISLSKLFAKDKLNSRRINKRNSHNHNNTHRWACK